jgi:hypothetical protein
MGEKKQWRVIRGKNYAEIFDNEPEARRAYGKQRNLIRDEGNGHCELYERDNTKAAWIQIQEFKISEDEE